MERRRLSILRGTFAVGFLGAVVEPVSTCVSRYPGKRVFRTRKAGPRVRDGGGHVSPDGRMRTNPKAYGNRERIPLSLARSLAQRHPLSLAPSLSLAAASTRSSPLACQSAPRFRRESSFIRRGVTPTPRWMLLNRVLVSAICIVARFLAVCPAFVEGQ